MASPTRLYTSQDEIERLMSVKSAELYVDDIGIGMADDPEIWTDVIDQATDTVNMYAQYYYEESVLELSSWVRRTATWIAAHYLTQRRGNPGAYSSLYEQAIEYLERIKKGELQIPRAVLRSVMVPAMSNYTIDDRFRVNKIRVQPSISVGPQSSEQDIGGYQGTDPLF
jgi:phage gp36-like protein